MLNKMMMIVAVISASAPAFASEPHHANNLMGESVGLAGYDPVAYFPEGGGKPAKGSIKISVEHGGVTYRFATEAHRALFQKTPAKYVPAYGGWCAFAVAELNKRVDIDPTSFEIRNGKLYVFYRDQELDTRALWAKSPEALINKANGAWPKLAE